MSKYTAGKLCTTPGTYITDEGSVVVARVDFGRPQEEYEANASRIVACWNACEGISTEALVAMPTPFSKLLSAEFTDVVAQRDALLAALEIAQDTLDNVQGDINPERGYADELEAEVSLALGTARAAIAEAKAALPPLTATGTAHEGASNMTSAITQQLLQGDASSQRFTSISKGGTYERLGTIQGAGSFKGLLGVAYRNEKGSLFIREPECFAKRMVLIKPEGDAQ